MTKWKLANAVVHFQHNLGNYTVPVIQARNNHISWKADWRFLINELFLTIEIGIIDDTSDSCAKWAYVKGLPSDLFASF